MSAVIIIFNSLINQLGYLTKQSIVASKLLLNGNAKRFFFYLSILDRYGLTLR